MINLEKVCILFKRIYYYEKIIFINVIRLFISCSSVQNPDYERNLEITKEWFETFGDEDLDNTMSYFADEIEYQCFLWGP